MVVSRKEIMSYEQRAHVIVLGATLERAVDKVHELVGTQGVESIVTQKHNHIVKTSNGIIYRAQRFSPNCKGLRADILYVDSNATSKDSDDFQDTAEPIAQLPFIYYLAPGFDPIIWF